MRIRKKKWAQPELEKCGFFVKEPESFFGRWEAAFKNGNPIYLEVGCGKGSFAGQFALRSPEKNIIAVDIKIDMLGVARRSIVKLFAENGKTEEDIKNVLLVNYNVEQIDRIISEEDKIHGIYINFCNPWPRPKHKKRRLTYPKKLMMYKKFLVEGGKINFKTDDDGLFDESLEYFESCGCEVAYITRDLHGCGLEGNIETEHEKMFSSEGKKIKFCSVVPKS